MDQKNQKSHEEQVKELTQLIDDVKFGMLTTIEPDGSLRSRPMANVRIEEDGSLWFFTYEHSPKCDEITRDHRVNMTFSEPKKQKYASITGKANIVRDRKKMEELWSPLYKPWFPKGLEEPDMALLKIDVTKAEYWESPNTAVVRIIGFAKAIITGKAADNVGTHEKINYAPLTGAKKDVNA